MKKELIDEIQATIDNIQSASLNPVNWSLTDSMEFRRLEELLRSKGLEDTWQFQNLHSFLKQKKYEDNNGVTAIFQFPEHLKTPCEQYLTYFAVFLKDIGITSNVSLEGRGLDTFFKTVPKDYKQALEKIQKALMIYLSIPVAGDHELRVLEKNNLKHRMAFERLKYQNALLKKQLEMNEVELAVKNEVTKSRDEVIRAKDEHAKDLKHNLKLVLIYSLRVLEIQGKPQSRKKLDDFIQGNINIPWVKLAFRKKLSK